MSVGLAAYVCMYVRVFGHIKREGGICVDVYACMYVCMYVRLHTPNYVYGYVYIYKPN